MAENLIETVEKQQAATERLERIIFGDPPVHPAGLMAQIELLNLQLEMVRDDLVAVKRRHPNMLLWIGGYLAFMIAGLFAMVAFWALPEVRAVLDLSAPVAGGLSLLFATAAMLLCIGGFGWFSRGP